MKLRPIFTHSSFVAPFTLFSTLCFLLISNLSFAQQNGNPQDYFSKYQEDLSWVSIAENSAVSAHQFFAKNHQVFGLEDARSMKEATHNVDKLGWIHHKFNQYYKDVLVEGGTFILHEKNGKVLKANGKIYPNVQTNTQASITAEKAIALGLEYHPAKKYLWENSEAERILKESRRDQTASYYPQAELIIVDRAFPEFSNNMALAYKMEIQSEEPLARYFVYIDAQDGSLLHSYNNIHPTMIEGTAETKYHGTQTISTIQDEDGLYMLQDTSRGVLIQTLNAQDDYNIVPFFDDDNYWDNVNAQQDEAATDAHYGAASTFDFYRTHFDRNSYDDSGATLTSLVHVGTDWNNASWNGDVMSYGDGDGAFFNPLTALDVCGHELTHAVTEYTAGLIYSMESGALNESFSDIFGKAIEFEYAEATFDWKIGSKVMAQTGNFIRSMEDPNLRDDPKFYQGFNWHVEESDNFGVHTNSGVQNYWFYLLVEGGQGVAEDGYAFDFEGLGWTKSIEIAYRNLSVYLMQSSSYEDARVGSLEAAKDLFGYCSDEYLTVAKAWAAVGVGYEVMDGDFLMKAKNDLGASCEIEEVIVSLRISNLGCTETLDAGTIIPVTYQLDTKTPVTEEFVLPVALLPGEGIDYTFTQKVEVNEFGTHVLVVSADPPGDVLAVNNKEKTTFTSRPYQNEDFALVSVRNPGGVCEHEPQKDFTAIAAYLGCDTIAPVLLPFDYTFKSLTKEGQESTLNQQIPFIQTRLSGGYYFNEFGFDEGVLQLLYPDDPNPANDIGHFYIARLRHHEIGWREDFSATELDSMHLGIFREEKALVAMQGENEEYAYAMTGSDLIDDFGNLELEVFQDPEIFFRRNDKYITTMDLCIDVGSMTSPALVFDLAQLQSNFDLSAYGVDPDFATMVGVFVDGVQLGDLLYGSVTNTDFQTYEFDLTPYKFGSHNLQIKCLALNGAKDANGEVMLNGDVNMIDYLEIVDQFGVSTTDQKIVEEISVSPNPSTGTFYLSRSNGESFVDANLEVFNAAGKLEFAQQVQSRRGTYTFGEDLIPGIYFVRVIEGDRVGFVKVVKQ